MGDARADEYYIRLPRVAAPPPPMPLAEPGDGPLVVPLASGSGRTLQRTMAVLVALAGICAAFLVPLLLHIFTLFLWSSSDSDRAFFIGLGVFIAFCGVAAGVLMWLPWHHRPQLTFDDESFSLRYPGFAKPFVVPRALVRLVAVDDRKVVLFQRNDRFPVHGELPEVAFADALDRYPAMPWEPPAPDSRAPTFPFPGMGKPASQHLFSADGSALPVLRVNPGDVPNIAIVLDESVRTPRPPFGLVLGCRAPVFAGGRRVRGMLLRVSSAERAAAAFGRWDVVRDVTAQDVIEEDLRLPKPLAGWRAAVYGVVLFLPVVLKIIFRNRI
jgi:hypothetical protein